MTVHFDLAKGLSQAQSIDAAGMALGRRQLRRADVLKFFAALRPCRLGMEACPSAQHWDREVLALGHVLRSMPPAYVKSYVKRGKTDVADAEALWRAVTQPTMRFFPVKSVDQQSVLMLRKTRDLLIR